MKLLCIRISSLWLLCLMVQTCSSTTVKGLLGQNITLPCKYDIHYHGKCEICWMRGDVPYMGCGDEIIATDGDKVFRQTSIRYQLNGELQKGDVALTIISATQQDSGIYGCRVHVQGLFNDIKTNVHLIIMEAPKPTAEVSSSTPKTLTIKPWQVETIPVVHTVTYSNTFPPEYDKTVTETSNDTLPVTLVSVALILLLLGTASIYLLWKQKRRSREMETAQNTNSFAIYNNSEVSFGVPNRTMVVENIYQLDNERENVYEQWS